MKKNNLWTILLLAVLGIASCGEDEIVPVVDNVGTDEVRIIVKLPTTVVAADEFVFAGSFKTDAWTPEKSTTSLKKNTDGTYSVDVKLSSFDKTLEYKVVKNPKNGTDGWKFVEKDADCKEVDNRKILDTDAGKTLNIEVKNFRNTGTCPN